jgi:hypothetical protein
MQACKRSARVAKPPILIFLHGNVGVAYRIKLNGVVKIVHAGRNGFNEYTECSRPPILFPVTQKDYQSDPFIAKQWEWMRMALKDAFIFTVFGYGAPQTDVEAMKLMSEGWGRPQRRNMEDTEIIDIQRIDRLRKTWKPFMNHYTILKKYEASVLAKMPRRSVEGAWMQNQEDTTVEPNRIPQCRALSELHRWFQPLIEAERQLKHST